MKASYQWLKALTGLEMSPVAMGEQLTRLGLEVEAISPCGVFDAQVVCGHVLSVTPHPERSQLGVVKVDVGREVSLVTDAPDLLEAGLSVAVAEVGARLATGLVQSRTFGAVVSEGKLCSELDLGLGDSARSLVELDRSDPAGQALTSLLGAEDATLEIALTPNRPDCLGHVGLARELCVASGALFNVERPTEQAETGKTGASFLSNEAEGLVRKLPLALSLGEEHNVSHFPIRLERLAVNTTPVYALGLVQGVRVKPAPFAWRVLLSSLGMRPRNNVVDATNLLMMLYGHPVHAFDAARVRGGCVCVRHAESGETMRTLDGVERHFAPEDTLICDLEGPIAVAGIMGGEDCEIGEETRDVLLECAYFQPSAVRRAAKRLNMHTEASHRFERGADPLAVPRVLEHGLGLIANAGNGVAAPHALLSAEASTDPAPAITFRAERAARVLGTAVDIERARRIFTLLGGTCEDAEGDVLRMSPPSWRPDLLHEIDWVEEVARVIGYDAIDAALPTVPLRAQSGSDTQHFQQVLRLCLASLGFHEAVNLSLVSPESHLGTLEGGKPIRLKNPLSSERTEMRTSLLPGLLENVARGRRHQVPSFRLFEVGRVFALASHDQVVERVRLGVVLAGDQREWMGSGRSPDFFDIKGLVQHLVQSLGGQLPAVGLPDGHVEAFHPKQVACAQLHGRTCAIFGVLHPDVTEKHNVPAATLYAELDVSLLAEAFAARHHQSRDLDLPRFPAVQRDFAWVVPEQVTAGEVIDCINNSNVPYVESVTLFDVYRGESIEVGNKSLAFRVTLRRPDGTLEEEELVRLQDHVSRLVEHTFGASLRD